METPTLLAHFEASTGPLTLPRGGLPRWDNAGFHRAAYGADPEGYALLSLAPGVHPGQRARVLLQVLAASQAGLTEPVRDTLTRVAHVLALGLPPAQVITVLLALRRLRANHKHTTRAVLRYVLEHPEADALIAARRPALTDCFEHALGKSTARGCARRIAEGDTGSEYLRRRLLRFVADPAAALRRVAALYAPGPAGVPAPREPALRLETARVRPPTVTATNRGEIAATLVHMYRGGQAAGLHAALSRYVAAATAGLPRMAGTVAMVLDASASMRGYGDREWALASQAQALRLVLSRVCTGLTVIEVGGGRPAAAGAGGAAADGVATDGAGADGAGADDAAVDGAAVEEATAAGAADPVATTPQGATDLAGGLLAALATGPDLVAIVSDGYENVLPGDLARVVATLPRAGISTPVVFCQALFTDSDDLSLRRPAAALPSRGFWAQDDFAELLPWMFAHCRAGAGWVRAALRARLDQLDGRNGAAASSTASGAVHPAGPRDRPEASGSQGGDTR